MHSRRKKNTDITAKLKHGNGASDDGVWDAPAIPTSECGGRLLLRALPDRPECEEGDEMLV